MNGEGHWECDCVPNLGPSHCHACSVELGREVTWNEHIVRFDAAELAEKGMRR